MQQKKFENLNLLKMVLEVNPGETLSSDSVDINIAGNLTIIGSGGSLHTVVLRLLIQSLEMIVIGLIEPRVISSHPARNIPAVKGRAFRPAKVFSSLEGVTTFFSWRQTSRVKAQKLLRMVSMI